MRATLYHLRLMVAAVALLATFGTALPLNAARKVDVPAGPQEINAQGLLVRILGLSSTNIEDGKDVIELQAALTTDRAPTPPLADDLSFFLRQRLLELGYPEVKVDWNIVGSTIVLTVNEGPRYAVGKMSFPGNNSQPQETMEAYLLRPTNAKLGTSGDSPPFIKALIEKGTEIVQRYLQSQGFLNAEVIEPEYVMQPATATVDISARIREGRRFQIGRIEFQGDLLNQREDIEKLVQELPSQNYNEVNLETARKNMLSRFQAQGYFGAEVTWAADPANVKGGAVPVIYRVDPGELFFIANLDIDPRLSKGAKRVAQAHFKRSIGRRYSPDELELMNRETLDSEIFGRLDVTPKRLTDNTLALELTGEEAKRKRLAVYGGYETFLGPIGGFEYRVVNVFDSGRTAQIEAEVNGTGFNGELGLNDPAFLNSPFSLDFGLKAEAITFFDYTNQSIVFRPTLERKWNKHFRTALFGNFNVSVASAEPDTLSPLELGPDEYYVMSGGGSLAVDFKNNPVSPTKGWALNAAGEIGEMGSEFTQVDFFRGAFSVAYYQPITKRFRAAAAARTAIIATNDDLRDIPINERLFNGGASTVRSFKEREMGIRSMEGDTPLGGVFTQVFNVELSYEAFTNFEVALFGDMGKIRETNDDFFNQQDDFSYAIGLGLRYKLPIGPLRIDYGFNPDRQEDDDLGALHITFGFAF